MRAFAVLSDFLVGNAGRVHSQTPVLLQELEDMLRTERENSKTRRQKLLRRAHTWATMAACLHFFGVHRLCNKIRSAESRGLGCPCGCGFAKPQNLGPQARPSGYLHRRLMVRRGSVVIKFTTVIILLLVPVLRIPPHRHPFVDPSLHPHLHAHRHPYPHECCHHLFTF